MTYEKYNEFWKNIFLPTMSEIDTDKVCKLKSNAFDKIYMQYQNQRKYIHDNYMEDADSYIDRHKIAACLMCSIERIQPLKIPLKFQLQLLKSKEKLTKIQSYANEYLAFYSAISILDNFYEYDQSKNILHTRRKKIDIPKTFNDNNDYVFDFCLDLYFANQKKMLNVLAYANVFFLLEYNFNSDDFQEKL